MQRLPLTIDGTMMMWMQNTATMMKTPSRKEARLFHLDTVIAIRRVVPLDMT
jgi:hypothetical protein